MKIVRKFIIDASAGKVWKIFAHDFDNAYKWMASIPKSYGKDIGKKFDGAKTSGRICELDKKENGMKASEQFLSYDEEAKFCTVEIRFINAPKMIPIRRNVLDFAVRDIGNGQSEVDWVLTPDLKPFGYLMYPLIKGGLVIFMNQIIEELQFYVETDTPHQRKLKNLGKNV
jgi:hypothetical protein